MVYRILTTQRKERPAPPSLIGQYGIWTLEVDGKPVTSLVRIIGHDRTKRFQDRELQVQTNTGSRAWTSTKKVEMVPDPLEG